MIKNVINLRVRRHFTTAQRNVDEKDCTQTQVQNKTAVGCACFGSADDKTSTAKTTIILIINTKR